jgi:hypothetical protein
MGVVPVAAAGAAEGVGAASILKELVTEVLNPEMIRALSPTEGFEAKPHTFQAVETEGHWKLPPDWPPSDSRALAPPSKRVSKVRMHTATILSIDFKAIDAKYIQALLQLLIQSLLPSPTLATLANLATTALPPGIGGNFFNPSGPLGKLLPSLARALADLQVGSSAEIEAVWWSDGFEIWGGQAAAKHVRGFGSLFGHQARVELEGVPFGNYFPTSYCLTFTGFVNPVGPTFEELRGAVKLGADGSASGLFCQRSNRDKKEPEDVSFGGPESGYALSY